MRPRVVPTPQLVEAVAELVRRRTGLVFSAARRAAFAAMGRANSKDPATYLSLLEKQPTLLDALVAEVTVGETYFFREPQQFALIRDVIAPALLSRRAANHPLRIWSAGCATGEEAYSLAILARELALPRPPQIIATDLSRDALATAQRGRYSRWSFRGVPQPILNTWFERAERHFHLIPGAREAVEFRSLNLAEDTFPSLVTGVWGMDLILCRNVLIYFDMATVAQVARRLIDSLSDDGWLLLGASDPAISGMGPCEVVVTDAGLVYRRSDRADARVPARPATIPRVVCPPPLEGPATASQPLPTGPAPWQPRPVPQACAATNRPDAAQCYAQRDYARVAELAAAVVQRDGSDPAPWTLLVRALANRGELEAAGRACAAALDRHRSAAELTYLHAVRLAEGRRHADAVAAARRALYLDHRLVVAHLALGAALGRLGEAGGARRSSANAERLLTGLPPDEIVPASDGERAARLLQIARVQLGLLEGAAA